MSRSRKRPWLAAVLSLLHPGIGHLYLREWLRAALWFVMIITATAAFLGNAVPETVSVEAVVTASERLPVYATVTILTLVVFSMLDAYALATRNNRLADRAAATGGSAVRCPSCGRDLDDPDMEFCPWCAEEFDPDETTNRRAAW